MIDRYALPELREIFGERHKLELWLQIELLALEALAESGVVPEADYERIRREVGEVDPDRAREIERESQHDVIAFLRSITERPRAGGALAPLRADELGRPRHGHRGRPA